MRLKWYGHSCFKLETEQGSVVFDPFEPDYVPGLYFPGAEADACLCSHEHGDHGYAPGVKLSGGEHGLKIKEFQVFHDGEQGRLRGKNRLYLVEAGGKRVLHLGDLGHGLSRELAEELQGLELLLLPVGGFYTIGPEQAAEIVWQLRPRITVPMHYKGEGFGFEVLAEVEDFTRLLGAARYWDSPELDTEDIEGEAVIVLRCPVKE